MNVLTFLFAPANSNVFTSNCNQFNMNFKTFVLMEIIRPRGRNCSGKRKRRREVGRKGVWEPQPQWRGLAFDEMAGAGSTVTGWKARTAVRPPVDTVLGRCRSPCLVAFILSMRWGCCCGMSLASVVGKQRTEAVKPAWQFKPLSLSALLTYNWQLP